MVPPPFQSNPSKRYKVKSIYDRGKYPKLSSEDFTNLTIYINETDSCLIKLRDIFQKYRLPRVRSDEVVNRWHTNPMQFYQNQINFVVWCSTTGCGVGYEHLNHKNLPLRSFFRFHLYYQSRRLLKEMSCPASFQTFWNAFENNIDISVYQDLCRQFHVSDKSMWKQHKDTNSEMLGTAYYYSGGKYRPVPGNDYDNSSLHNSYNKQNDYSDATVMSFGNRSSTYSVAYIAQNENVDNAWTGFILNGIEIYNEDEEMYSIEGGPEGFTDIGTELINDSIRTYVYAILGAQAQTKTSLLTPGTGLDAQRQFVNIVEDCINSPVDLQRSIQRYQDSLQYARSSLNFAFGEGLYLAPSDMDLRIGHHFGYNNNIHIANDSVKLGSNENINSELTLAPLAADTPPLTDTLNNPTDNLVDTPVDLPLLIHEREKLALILGMFGIFGIGYLTYKLV